MASSSCELKAPKHDISGSALVPYPRAASFPKENVFLISSLDLPTLIVAIAPYHTETLLRCFCY